jgi:hypothetical protein
LDGLLEGATLGIMDMDGTLLGAILGCILGLAPILGYVLGLTLILGYVLGLTLKLGDKLGMFVPNVIESCSLLLQSSSILNGLMYPIFTSPSKSPFSASMKTLKGEYPALQWSK